MLDELSSDLLQTKRILVITLGWPHPSRGASTVLFYWYLKALRESQFRVSHLVLTSEGKQQNDGENAYIEAIEPNSQFDVCKFAVNGLAEVRRSGVDLQVGQMPAEVKEYAASVKPDAVVCFDVIAAEIARDLKQNNLLVWLGDLNFQTILYHAYYDFRERPGKIFSLIKAYIGGVLWKQFYKKALNHQRNVIVSSHSSVVHLEKIGIESQYWSYPWPDSGPLIPAAKYDKPTFIMFGTLAALGSRSAFDFLIRSIYPLLLENWGKECFSIQLAGMREMPSWVRTEIESLPEFSFLGFVDDLGAEVAKCHGVLAPISVPVGNRSRIVTAMSMGAVVIAHANTVMGNPELVSGRNCLLASTAEEFVQQMQAAYSDQNLSETIGREARTTYLNSFEPTKNSIRLVRKLEAIVANSK